MLLILNTFATRAITHTNVTNYEESVGTFYYPSPVELKNHVGTWIMKPLSSMQSQIPPLHTPPIPHYRSAAAEVDER